MVGFQLGIQLMPYPHNLLKHGTSSVDEVLGMFHVRLGGLQLLLHLGDIDIPLGDGLPQELCKESKSRKVVIP